MTRLVGERPSTLVSVVIPAFNSARYIGLTIDSVLAQTYRNFEIIVVDDGSTDNTAEVLRPYLDHICYIRQENQGVSAAQNTGLRKAQGKYIVFLGADDLLMPHKLASQVEYLEKNQQVGLVASGYTYITEDGSTIGVVEPWNTTESLNLDTLLLICPFILQAALIRREWIECVGGFDECIQRAEDWDLLLRMVYEGCMMRWLKEVVCEYRIHSSSLSRNGLGMKIGIFQVLGKFYSQLTEDDPLHETRIQVYCEAHLRGFSRETAAGEFQEAKHDLELAIQLNPNLVNRNNQKILDFIVGTANSIYVSDPDQYINSVLENLPEELSYYRSRRRELLSLVRMHRFYREYQLKNWSSVRRTYLEAVAKDLSWLTNKGALRMWLDAIVGRERVDRLRNQFSRSSGV